MRQMRQMRASAEVDPSPGDTRDWFRLGMVSATVVTPLITRWRALRAAERARAVWQASQASARWPWTRAEHAAELERLPPLARREVRTGLWLAGVAVGLGAAGTAAFIIARRRLHADEPPLDLPLITHTTAPGADDSIAELPSPTGMMPPTGVPARHGGTADDLVPALDRAELGAASAAPNEAPSAPSPPAPAVVGNTQTLLYVSADGADLPPEDLRIYFASADQATQAGYHPAPGSASAPDPLHP